MGWQYDAPQLEGSFGIIVKIVGISIFLLMLLAPAILAVIAAKKFAVGFKASARTKFLMFTPGMISFSFGAFLV
ncbi:MAG: hypothetical protein K2Q06_03375, partial [Parvularculaceae bacterium]|nr:hypothetical protein [Parvularculaceae bacterium]